MRPRYLTCKIPETLYRDVENLKDILQNEEIKISSRQVIGRDGIALAAVAYLLSLPVNEQKDFVKKGVERLRELTPKPTTV